MNKFSIEDYLQILAEKMKDKPAEQPEENKKFVYASEKVIADLGKFEYRTVNYPNPK